jgi:dynein heavy chain, axonemal
VQSKWLYLEPVFSSEDIQNQMKNEGRWFKEINQEWRLLMNEVKENPAAMTVIKIQKLEERLTTSLEQLEKVLGGLNQYLQSKRGKFP